MTALVKPVTWILGLVLALVGVIGFFVNPIYLFTVNPLHNVVHLASGIVALWAASSSVAYARMYLIIFGLVYGLVAVAGYLGVTAVVDLLNINDADNLLHVAIAAVCLIVGFGSKARA